MWSTRSYGRRSSRGCICRRASPVLHSRYAPSEYPFSVWVPVRHLHVNYVLIKQSKGRGGWGRGGAECEANKRKAQSNIGKPIKGRSICAADLLPTLPASSSLSLSLLFLLLSALLVCFAFVTFRIYTLIHVKRQDDNLCAMCFPCTQSASSLLSSPSIFLHFPLY